MATLPPIKKFLTTGETACALGILKDHLMKKVDRGDPPGAIMGGRYMFFDPDYLDELREWLREQGVEFTSTVRLPPGYACRPVLDQTAPEQGERERQAVLNKYGHKPKQKPQPATV